MNDDRIELYWMDADRFRDAERVDFIEIPERNSNSLILFKFKKKENGERDDRRKPAA